MKNKWLLKLLTVVMAFSMCAFFASCQNMFEPAGSGKSDADLAKEAIETLTLMYPTTTTETAVDYEVIGQTKVGDSYYQITWSVTPEAAAENVKIGEMDPTTKKVKISITKGEEAIEYKLKASVTVGSETASFEFARKIPARPRDAAGTKEDPYSPSKVIEIASGLTVNTYYHSAEDEGKDVPTLVWVEGYLVEWGKETLFTGGGRVSFVYIVDEYTAEKDRDSADALCIASIDYDEENLTCLDDLVKGNRIVVKGYIELYQGGTTTTPKPELAYFKDSNNTYHNVYCEELEKPARTPQQSVELALDKVEDTLIVNEAGDYTLPESTVPGVTFTWSTTDKTYTVADNKLHIETLPAEDATVTVTVTATYGTETVTNNTKDVTVTIKAAVTAEEGSAVFDFSGVSEKGDGLTDGDATEYFQGFASANSNLTEATVTKIYKGNGDGGAHANSGGFLKAGTSKATGQIVLTFSKNVKSVVVNCHDWYAKSEKNPTNSNKVIVNDEEQLMPYNETGTPGDLTFTLSEETNVITIGINKRGFIFKITVTFAEGGDQPGPAPSEDSLELTSESLSILDASQSSGYAKYKGTHTVGTYEVTVNDVMVGSEAGYSVLQFKKKSGTLSVTGSFTRITIIVVSAFQEEADYVFSITAGETELKHTLIKTEDTGKTEGENAVKIYTLEYITTAGEQEFTLVAPTAHAGYASSIVFDNGSATTPETPDPGPEPDPTNKYGTLDAPLTVAQALALAAEECATADAVTAQVVYMQGVALSTPDQKSGSSGVYYGQFDMADTGTQTKILVYSVNLRSGVAAPAQNDILVICGYIKNYSGTIEFTSANGTNVYVETNTRGNSTVTLGEHDGADVTGIETTKTLTNGTEVTFTVTAQAGKQIVAVKAGDTTLEATGENTYKFTLAGDTTITVETADAGAVLDEMVSLSFDNKAQRTTRTNDQQVWAQNGITFTNNKASSTTNVGDYSKPVRCYKSSSITVEHTVAMNKIVFHCNSSSYANQLVSSIGTDSGVTVEHANGSSDVTVTFTTAQTSFTIASLANQIRIDSIDVYYTPTAAAAINAAPESTLPGNHD